LAKRAENLPRWRSLEGDLADVERQFDHGRMTTMVPTPEIVALHAVRRATARVLDFLIAVLTPSTCRARHRAPSPLKVRLRQWKSAVVGLPVRPPRAERTRYPAHSAHPATPGFDVPRTEAWNSFHPPPRTAQCTAFVEPPVDHLPPVGDTAVEWPPEDLVPSPEVRNAMRLAGSLADCDEPTAVHLAVGETDAWEFTPGELTRWFDDIEARLMAPGGISGRRPW
jgi:hypothetical protein